MKGSAGLVFSEASPSTVNADLLPVSYMVIPLSVSVS